MRSTISCATSARIATENTNGSRCITTPKLLGGCTGKGFVKGDPRINRKGKPKSFKSVQLLALRLAREQGESGELAITELLRSWRDSKEPVLQKAFVEYAFGKVPDKLEADLNTRDSRTLYFSHERSRLSPSLS